MENKKAGKLVCSYILVLCIISSMLVSMFFANETKNNNGKILSPDFWADNLHGDKKVIISQKEIEDLNTKNLIDLKGYLYDLKNYPSSLSNDELTKLLEGQQFPNEDRYLHGRKVEQSYYDNLKKQINLAGVKDINEVHYALTVRRTNIRTLPTSDESLSEPNDVEFDNFQETEVQPIEPVLVLHQSLDKSWSFVQTYNYRGWMLSKDFAVAKEKAIWQTYLDSKNFLVVTANKLRLGYNVFSPEISELEYDMGVKIPLVPDSEIPQTVDNQSTYGNYAVKVPVSTANGELSFKQALIPLNSDVSVGYMSYTRENILRQAFKSSGERYGWGGMFNAKDCSSFILNIFKCFGIMLPRNTGEQEIAAGKTIKFDASLSQKERFELIDKLQPGAALYFPGHTMLYLGKYNGHYYMIHDVYAVGDIDNKKPDGTLPSKIYNQVTVSDLETYRRNGKQFINSLTSGKQFE